MDPPSEELVLALETLGVSPHELRRCRTSVREFARGLPTYDSVWIDALVRRGALTPFQAVQLENKRAADLIAAPQTILTRPRVIDPVMSLYDARDISTGRSLCVTRLVCGDGSPESAAQRLSALVRQQQAQRQLLTLAPLDLTTRADCFLVVSPAVEGKSLSHLMVRRGRFPEDVVRAIGAELAVQLQVGTTLGPHGDVRLSNVLLTDQGNVLLLHWGLLAALCPELTIHSPLPVDAGDGMAPERMAALRPATLLSDVYSLGCLLWQLLAGRPPFPVADPLAKLLAHQHRQVPDVRSVAPETSVALAQLLQKMTVRESHRRLQSFLDVSEALGGNPARHQQRLRKFVRSFESSAPRQLLPTRRRAAAPLTAATVGMLGIVLAGVAWNRERLGLPSLSQLSAASRQTVLESPPSAPVSVMENNVPATHSARPLPAPDANGVVNLDDESPYEASSIVTERILHLQAPAGRPATLLLRQSAPVFQSPQVILENIRLLVLSRGEDDESRVPLGIRSQQLTIRHCWCASVHSTTNNVPIIEWDAIDPQAADAGRILVTDCAFHRRTALRLLAPLSSSRFQNVLKTGAGSLVELQQGVRAGLKVPLLVERCTVVRSGPLVILDASDETARGRLSIQGSESVIQPASGVPLVELKSMGADEPRRTMVEIAAGGLIVHSDQVVAGWRPSADEPFQPLDPGELSIDGLLAGEFHFEPAGTSPDAAEHLVIDSLPVRISDRLPGIDHDRQPTPPASLEVFAGQ